MADGHSKAVLSVFATEDKSSVANTDNTALE
jgi:hypothetical protein